MSTSNSGTGGNTETSGGTAVLERTEEASTSLRVAFDVGTVQVHRDGELVWHGQYMECDAAAHADRAEYPLKEIFRWSGDAEVMVINPVTPEAMTEYSMEGAKIDLVLSKKADAPVAQDWIRKILNLKGPIKIVPSWEKS